jgi:hypothetical protein
MNAHVERFNRTVQESFVDDHEDLLFTDLVAFNQQLADWLVFYNAERPHHTLGQRPPLRFLLQHQPECQRWWTHTDALKSFRPGSRVPSTSVIPEQGRQIRRYEPLGQSDPPAKPSRKALTVRVVRTG